MHFNERPVFNQVPQTAFEINYQYDAFGGAAVTVATPAEFPIPLNHYVNNHPEYLDGSKLTPGQKTKYKVITLVAVAILVAVGIVIAGVMSEITLLVAIGMVIGLAGVIGGISYAMKKHPDLDLPSERNRVIEKIANYSLPKLVKKFSPHEIVGYHLLRNRINPTNYQRFLGLYAVCNGLNAQYECDKNAIAAEYHRRMAPYVAEHNQQVNSVNNRMVAGHAIANISHFGDDRRRRHNRLPNAFDGLATVNDLIGVGQNIQAGYNLDQAAAYYKPFRDTALVRAERAYSTAIQNLDTAYRELQL